MIKKLYKYYFYYFDNELYAYTDNKTFSKQFELYRDMKKFVKVIKKINKEEVNILAKENKDKYISSYKFFIFNRKNGSGFEILIPLTFVEKISLTNTAIQLKEIDIYKYCWIPSYIFNSKIRKALSVLYYDNLNKHISSDGTEILYLPKYFSGLEIDYFSLFVRLFGFTLNMKGKI